MEIEHLEGRTYFTLDKTRRQLVAGSNTGSQARYDYSN